MKTYDFVHLVLHAADGKIDGRTKLQKMVYFAGVMADCEKQLGYHAHFYGPYSSKVAAAVTELRSLGFLEQSVAGGGTIDNRGFEVARYDYSLTEDGKEIAEEKTLEHPRRWKQIKKAVKKLQQEPIDYMKLSIAAKAHYLARKSGNSGSDSTHEELSKKARRLGWDVSDSDVRKAVEWLENVGLAGNDN